MKRFMNVFCSFVLPYRFLSDPEYKVSRNLMSWDSMIRNHW
jgi:hypothetical protein